MGKWEMVRLGDVINIDKDIVSPETAQKQTYVGLENITKNSGEIVFPQATGNEVKSSKFAFTNNHILYGKLRPNLNKVALPDFHGVCSTDIYPISVNPELAVKGYICAILRDKNFVSYATSRTNGINLPRVNERIINDYLIPLPPLPTQQKIATTLDTVADILRLRRAQLEQLDLLVKARFVEMFGDITNSKKLNDICLIITDGTHQPPKFVSEGIPFLFISNIVDNSITYETKKYISRETYETLIKRTPVEIGDILLTTVGSYGNPAVVQSNQKFCFQRHIAYLKPNHDIVNSLYLHSAFLSDDVKQQIDSKVKGIAQKTLNLSELKTIAVKIPPLPLQSQFATFVTQVDHLKQTVRQAIAETQTLFDSLMSKYFA